MLDIKKKFPEGIRVTLSLKFLNQYQRPPKPKVGTVVGYSRSKLCVRVHWDGTSKESTEIYYHSYLTLERSGSVDHSLSWEELMVRQLIKQPNGKWAYWSTIIDNFLLTDASLEDIIQFRIKESAKEVRRDITEISQEIERGMKPYWDFTLSYEDCLKKIKR